ncbi:hypothetical protein CDAR_476111 [Caerostris darwini]|uniref:Uncharacterized protein n=1 Tax=Caerostris darwini TaxID=1538125 RepID=A0AAV4P8C2_9ARAC|nr:hypothetical protein CDAR_476111 [Caerostris darwini]
MASVSFVQLRASKWRVGVRGGGRKGLLASDIRGLRSECSTNLIRWPTHATLPSAGVGGKGGAVDYENGLSGSSADRLAPEWGCIFSVARGNGSS